MATITPLKPTNIGLTPAAFIATAPAGDVVPYAGSGSLLLEFDNGHASPITVNIAPTKTTGKVPGAGSVTIPTRALVIAAGAVGQILLSRENIVAYLNASNQVPLTYTGGNAAMTIRAVTIP